MVRRRAEETAAVADDGATLSIEEAHRLIGKDQISRGAIYDAVKRGDIPSLRLGQRILISRAWLTQKLKG
jgi:excisionase family DNA binding protein